MLFSNQKVSVVRFALILALLGGVLGVIPVMADTERTKSSKDIEQSYITQTDTNPVFTQVSTGSGSRYTCALTADGNVKCWGRNDTGQLGDGTATQRTAPVDVLVAPGGAPLTGVSAIATGFDHACALMTSGQVKCWGVNYWGQLGDGTLNAHTTPVDVLSIPGGLPLSGVIAITSSSHHTCALMSTGGVKCWGLNMRGQLGNSTTNNATTPVNVLLVPGSGTPLLGVSAVTAGGDHTCALTTSAGIKCWGYNFDGQLGDNTTTQRANPIDVIGLSSGVIAVSAGYNHTCAVTTGGEVKCWGNNNNGQLGDGTTTQRHTPVSVLTTPGGPGLSGISNVSAGGFVTCALTTIAGAKCWGGNAGGNLGDGTLFMRNTAVDVLEAPAGAPLSDVSKVITYGHSCALTTSGGVKCWGYNNYGQLGDGTNISRYNPVDLTFKTPQTISINTPAPTSAKYGTSFTVAAVTSSGLAVTYSASGACTNVGATFTMTSGSTTCTVNYEQAGDADYTFAPPLTSTVTAQRVPITVTADAKNRIYGEPDPVLTYQITSGTLVGTDTFTGALSRVAGSNVGTYAISKNTLALNSSKYILTYVGASLTINKRPITVTADAKTKTAGMPDPALTYQMTSGTLVTPDILTGSLSRDPGEAVGAYSIRQGTLSLSSNYDLTYTGANLTIVSNGSTVTNTNDSGIGSLRQTIADAASGDTITFDPSLAGQTITLASDLVINQDLTIDGSGLSPQVTVSGGSVAHLQIPISYHVVTISDLAIVNGHSGGDGGAILSYGDLTIRNSTLRDNHSAGSGGAIATSGMLTLENSTIEHNQADGLGGGISISAISASCCTITNSTLAQNQAGAGGAISFVGNGNSTITNTTFFQNQAVESGGAFYMSGNVVVDVSNSTIAGNNAPQGSELFTTGNGWIGLYDSILICKPENSSCIVQSGAFGLGNSDSIIGVGTLSDFGLAEPADNGGSTKTMALLPDSPLIDAGDDANCPATDQRGVARPQGSHCDIGAYEDQLKVRYVRWDAGGANNGISWSDAYTDLQSALAAASSDDEIWVAAGTYRPTTGTDRGVSFTLKNGVAVYGGFAGSETLRTQRDPGTNVTVLSGDIGIPSDNSDNSYHVVLGSNTNNSAIVDGFIITAGNADTDISPSNKGGGMYNDNGSPSLANVTFDGNTARAGGGMSNWNDSHPSLTDVTFSDNLAEWGGGISNESNSNPTLTNVTFSSNTAVSDTANPPSGGGIFNTASSPNLMNVTFNNNSADYGGGLFNQVSSSPTLVNVTFSSNSAVYGGGMFNRDINSSPMLTNVTLSNNSASDEGGAISNAGNPVIRNSILWGNTGGEIFNVIMDAAIVSNSIVQGGYPGSANIDADPLLGLLQDNGGFTKTMALGASSPAIDAGHDSICPATDQRGVTRPQGVHCDMGAFESDGPFVPTPTHTPTSTPTGTSTPTPTYTPTNTPTNTPTSTPPYSYNPLLLSLTGNQTISGISSSDEDILRFDGSTWSLLFDGSDVGVGSSDLFGFSVVDPDSLLMSFSSAVTVNGLAITPQDVVRFDATSLGTTTAGTFSMYLDGSDVGLDTTAEKIDSVSLLPDGRVLISTTGNPAVSGMTGGKDEDVLAFTPTSLGDVTSGSWAMYFDGSDVGLAETSGEDVDALDVVGGKVYLSTADTFSVNGVSGADEDVFVCVPTSLGDVTACNYSSALYFDGSTWGLSANDVDAFNSLTLGPVPTPTATSTPTSTPTATKTPTPGSQLLPDLTIIEMRNELQNTSCFTPGDPFGVRVWVRNNGQAAAGSFVVNVNGAEQTLNGLAVGETKAVFFPGSGNPVTATVDSTSVVAESDETNNTRSEMLPIPTAPLPCATPTFTPTPAATFTPTITYTPDASDLIFADGFESGNLSAWSSSSTDLGDLSVSTAAALAPAGSQGLQLVINDNNSMYLTDDSPMAEQRYRARFYFDPNSISMASNDVHFIFRGFTGTSTDVLRLEFRNSSGVYQLRAALLNDSSAWTNTNWFTVSDAPHFIELDWRAAIAAGANNGGLTLWIDGVQQADLTGVDNDALRIDRIRLGALTGIDIGTRGAYYFDAFESRRQSYIGP